LPLNKPFSYRKPPRRLDGRLRKNVFNKVAVQFTSNGS
jgi:hypothetical protein